VTSSAGRLDDAVVTAGATVGSPAQVVDKILSFREHFGPYQRQLFGMDAGGIPETVHETIDLAGAEVLPALREATAATPAQPALHHHDRPRPPCPPPARGKAS
jgi:alkanesulfonate monooxygenase SsuD/methylene tetrahydromethanopterin reductase-like flavin-dependent oxidoreductase (luciferase family)